MEKLRKYIAIGGTVVCALGIGFVMQFGRDVPEAQAPGLKPVVVETQPIDAPSPETTAPVTEVAQATAETPAEAPAEPEVVAKEETVDLEEVTLTAATQPARLPRALPDVVEPTPASLTGTEDLPAAPVDPETPQLGCTLLAQATEVQAAMVRVTVVAPCYPNERVTLHHHGMMFADTTDETGNLVVEIPALTEHAVFILAFTNGKGAVAQAHVPSLAGFDRVALQWSGNGGFQLHAREYGADYGDQGHVWSGNQAIGSDVPLSGGGFVTRLGDPDTFAPQVVEVYSFPTGTADRAGSVSLSIEAEVTDMNCGRDVSAQVLRLGPGRPWKPAI